MLNTTTTKAPSNPTCVIILKSPWVKKRSFPLFHVEYTCSACPPLLSSVKSEIWSIKLTRTRGSNVGQRCVGVCGPCQFATTSPALLAALFSSKGSNIYGLVRDPNIYHLFVLFLLLCERGVFKMNDPQISVQFSGFVLPDFEHSSPSRGYSKSCHGNVLYAETSQGI